MDKNVDVEKRKKTMELQKVKKMLNERGYNDVGVEDNMLCIYLQNFAIEGKEKETIRQIKEVDTILKEAGYNRSYIIKNPSKKNNKINEKGVEK